MSLRLEREIAQWRNTKQNEPAKHQPVHQVDEATDQIYVVPMDLLPAEPHDEKKFRKIVTGLALDEPPAQPWRPIAVTVEGPYHSRNGVADLIPQAMRGEGEPVFDSSNPLKEKYRGGPTVKGLKPKNGYTFRNRYT